MDREAGDRRNGSGGRPGTPGGPGRPDDSHRPDHCGHADCPGHADRRRPRSRPRRTTAAVCLVLGVGTLGGTAVGGWLTSGAPTAQAAEDRKAQTFELGRTLWHSVPVDAIFPPTVRNPTGGPGGADRTWKRTGVVPDSDCAGVHAFDPGLARILTPVGCERLLRATYTDSTSTTVTTVGVVTTGADERGMLALSKRWGTKLLGERTDLLPRPLAVPGTASASFGDRQRGSWIVNVHTDAPLIVYAVSGFADGRRMSEPQPADRAARRRARSVAAEAGLGHDAKGLQAEVDKRLAAAADQEWLRLHPTQREGGDR